MTVPNCENAVVPTDKITNYLLDMTHPHGKSKAKRQSVPTQNGVDY
jgi:hypothetical protein